MTRLLFLCLGLVLLSLVHGQAVQPEGGDRDEFDELKPGSPQERERMRPTACNQFQVSSFGPFRNFDGTCTNPTGPMRQLWGSTNRAQFSYFNINSLKAKRDPSLPSARELSNMLFSTKRDVFDPRKLNEMMVFFAQFIDHTLTATPANKAEPFPITIPKDDPVFGNTSVQSKDQLPFFRSERVKLSKSGSAERPLNSLTSLVDLDSVYGPSKRRSNAVASGNLGLLKVRPSSKGDLLPRNGNVGKSQLTNAPPDAGDKYFLAGDHRSNEHPVLTALHTLFVREHNDIARELKNTILPKGSDRELFEVARKINIAQMQKIVFKQWYQAVTGRSLPAYRGFKKKVDSSISVEFSTAAFRVGHTMAPNRISRLGPNLKKKPAIQFDKMFFREAKQMSDIDDFLRGALNNRAQKVDLEVQDALRNFLFESVKGEDGFDLMALNIQRGRDHALPSYSQLAKRFRGKAPKKFSDITSVKSIQSKLQTAYKSVRKVEAIVGLFGEDLQSGSSLGPTMNKIWEEEFTRLRDGDGFYYERNGQFSDELKSLKRVKDIFDDKVDTFRAILLRNTNIKSADIPPRTFFVR